jgi:hypothetical protein
MRKCRLETYQARADHGTGAKCGVRHTPLARHVGCPSLCLMRASPCAKENLEPVWSVGRRRQTILYHCSERTFASMWDMHFSGHNERNQAHFAVALGERLVEDLIKLNAQRRQVEKLTLESSQEEEKMQSARAVLGDDAVRQLARPPPTAAEQGVWPRCAACSCAAIRGTGLRLNVPRAVAHAQSGSTSWRK